MEIYPREKKRITGGIKAFFFFKMLTKIDTKQKVLGLLETTPEECRFYFSETNVGNKITSSMTGTNGHILKYLTYFYRNSVTLNEVLLKAGVIIVNEVEGCDIDLSPESLEKDTILNLLIKNKEVKK